jgi:hypothetical protein
MYPSIEVDANLKTETFRVGAQRLLGLKIKSPRPTTMVAAMFLGMGHLVHGKDHAVISPRKQLAKLEFSIL